MNKNLFKILAIVISLATLPAYSATKVTVEALSPFSSLNPPKTMKVITHEKVSFDNGIVFENGTIITGYVIDVKQPARGKRNATFKFQPTSYTYNGKTAKILDDEFIGKYKEKKEIDKGEMALSAATTAGGLLLNVPGLSQGVSLAKGAIKNEDDNRLKSGIKQVYKDSPLSYIEEGKDLIINKNDIFYFKFKTSDIEDIDADEDESLGYNDIQQQTTNVSAQPTIGDLVNTEITKPANLKFIHPDEVLKEVESAK